MDIGEYIILQIPYACQKLWNIPDLHKCFLKIMYKQLDDNQRHLILDCFLQFSL